MVRILKKMKGASVVQKKGEKGGKGADQGVKQLRMEMKLLRDEETAKKREEAMRQRLREWQETEEKFSRVNRLKIQNQWRKLMRMAKVESLRKELEILSQNHEREVDRKDAIIQMLDRDLDEAEEQYQTALRNHIMNVDKLVSLQEMKMRALEGEFESDLRTIYQEFQKERNEVLEQHNKDKKKLLDIMSVMENEFNENEGDARQDFESQCEDLKNRNLEELNMLKMLLENHIEELERHFTVAHDNYMESTETLSKRFKEYTENDAKDARTIDTQQRRLQKIQDSISHWKMKISNNNKECEERNKALREEKDAIAKHFQELKAKMNKFRESEAKSLSDLTIAARKAIKALEEQKQLGEKLLKLGELNRKMETERERVLPFHPILTMEEEDKLKTEEGAEEEIAEEMKSLQAFALDEEGKPVDEYDYLNNFFKRYNKVLLDVMAIKRERERLSQENSDLRTILKQYLDGISVNEDVMGAANPLFVVNSKTNASPVTRSLAQGMEICRASPLPSFLLPPALFCIYDSLFLPLFVPLLTGALLTLCSLPPAAPFLVGDGPPTVTYVEANAVVRNTMKR